MKRRFLTAAIICYAMILSSADAVTSVIARHNSSTDFLKGQTTDVVIDSTGSIRLAPQTEQITPVMP
jgi:hypothetical protein